jgi:hypothetical protein
MGRTYLSGPDSLTGFVHVNPDGSGTTYLRIAQAANNGWIGTPGNTSGGSGVNCAQLYIGGRTSSDPDFWGNVETAHIIDGPIPPYRVPAWDVRRQNVELFRFAFTLDSSSASRDMLVDAPVAGQQVSSNGVRYVGYFANPSNATPTVIRAVVVETGVVHVVPTPGAVMVLGVGGLAVGRRRVSRVGEWVRA